MDRITLAHGAGGQLTRELIEEFFYRNFKNDLLLQGNDSTILPAVSGRLVTSTDSFVIKPIFFKGGDIGKLSICGTVNDLAMSGASPLYITVGFILEEGFEIKKLEKIVESMAETASAAGIKIVAGDTKVVERGSCDNIYINTTGIGVLRDGLNIGGDRAKSGNQVIISGTIGDHGASIVNERSGLSLDHDLNSDCTLLNKLISNILYNCSKVKVLRDPSRGGVVTTLTEIAVQSKASIILNEDKLPIRKAVRTLCQITGLDPLYLANEGKVILIVEASETEKVLKILRNDPLGEEAEVIGEVVEEYDYSLYLKTEMGGSRILNIYPGDLLPRIC